MFRVSVCVTNTDERAVVIRISPLKRVIQCEVLNELSKMILAGKVNPEKSIRIDVEKR